MAPTLLRSAPCLPAALALISVLIAIALTPALMHVPSTRIGLARTHYRPILAAALTFRLSHSGIIMDATNEVTGSSPSYFFNAVGKVATASPGMLVATATETSTRLTLQNCQKPEDVRPYVTEHLSMALGFTGGVSDAIESTQSSQAGALIGTAHRLTIGPVQNARSSYRRQSPKFLEMKRFKYTRVSQVRSGRANTFMLEMLPKQFGLLSLPLQLDLMAIQKCH